MKPGLSQTLCPLLMVVTALNADIHVLPKVWGHAGQEEIILPCQLTPSQNNESVTQVQWELHATGVNTKIVHVVSTAQTNIPDEYKDKLELKEYSLVIKNLKVEDAGEYICTLTTFPGGSRPGKRTTLVVNKQMPLSAGVVSSIVISVILLLGIITATVYFVIRRCPTSSRNHISIDTQNAVWDPSKPSLIKKEEDCTDLALQPSSDNWLESLDDHMTYSEINVDRMRQDEALYIQVMKF